MHAHTHTFSHHPYLHPAEPGLHLSHNQTPSNLPFLPGATSARAFSMGDTPLPEEGDMLEGGVVTIDDTEDTMPTSSSTDVCSFSFLAHALRHSLLHTSLLRPLVVSHLTGVVRITLSQLAHVPCCSGQRSEKDDLIDTCHPNLDSVIKWTLNKPLIWKSFFYLYLPHCKVAKIQPN